MIPFVMRTLSMPDFGPLHPEDEEVTEVRLRYAGFREGDLMESCFSLYERPGILVQNPFRNPKYIAELASENVLGLVSRSNMFVYMGDVTYPPRDEVLMSL